MHSRDGTRLDAGLDKSMSDVLAVNGPYRSASVDDHLPGA